MGVHVFPILNPPPPPSPYHPSGSSQCTSPKLPVSCIEPGLAICFLYDIIHVLMPFTSPRPCCECEGDSNPGMPDCNVPDPPPKSLCLSRESRLSSGVPQHMPHSALPCGHSAPNKGALSFLFPENSTHTWHRGFAKDMVMNCIALSICSRPNTGCI